jgi:hypothetical protein
MNVLLDPQMPLREFLTQYCALHTDGEQTWVYCEMFFKSIKGNIAKTAPLDVPDEVVEALKLDSVL